MFSRSSLAQGSLRAARLHLIAAAVASIGLSACGDSKKATTTATGTTVTTPTTDGNTTTTVATGTTTTSSSAVNSDKNGTEPTDPSTSSVVVTPTSGSTVNLSYALLTNNPNATDANKRYGVTFYDYDPCVFTWNHGYSAFPSATFNFAAFFLENGTAGTVPTAGDYTSSATAAAGSMYIAAATSGQSGSGYGITSCKAASYASVTSGKISLTSSWAASGGTVGSINVTMNDGSTVAGSFTILTCKAGSATSQPTPPSPDSAACTSIK